MNILIIGGGGREHALGWKLQQSKRCGKLFFAPGNGGTAALGDNVPLAYEPVNTKNVDAIDYFCRQNKVGMVVVGPEGPLCEGLADRLTRPGRHVFGPSRAAARLEGDKAYAKQLMRAAAIPTADARVFTDYQAACAHVQAHETPVVVKAVGLAGGKGAIVCDDAAQALAALERCMVRKEFGEAGKRVVIEERLVGQEISVLALVDGRSIFVLDPAQDHKPVGEADTGPNTGGMGAYCPTPLVSDPLLVQIERQVLVPIVDALRRETDADVQYRGVLYAGLMLTAGGPKVLEFNVRLGDPECQPLMMRMRGDLVEIMTAVCEGRLADANLSWDRRACCCVVMTSRGYPGAYEKGKPITGIEEAEADPDVTVFHAGTAREPSGRLVTSGGRVLSVCALGENLQQAQHKANAACDAIHFEGAHFRRDIGGRVMSAT